MIVDIFNTEKKYGIIYADPPWAYDDKGCHGAAAKHYDVMRHTDMFTFPINRLAMDDCVLFMWTTYLMWPYALDLMTAWGFRYKTLGFQWIKQNKKGTGYFFGLGRWTRGNTEPCLIGIKGKPKRINAAISQLIFSPVREHSQKPDEVRQKIVELVGDLPRIELFARQTANGWDSWGNEL